MFASRTTKDVALPSDPAVTVTIKKLSWLQREDARKQSQQASSRDLVSMGGAEFLRVIKEMEQGGAPVSAAVGETTDPTDRGVVADVSAVVPADPIDKALATHDMLTVLVCGIKAWSDPAPVNKASIADLEPDDAEFLAREILRLSLPSATAEADRKNAE